MIKKIMKIFEKLLLIILISFLVSCGTIKKGFSNQKKNSSDEFLVEKKSPLVMPPNYNDLPIPKSENNESDSKDSSVKNLLKSKENTSNDSIVESSQNRQIDDFILEKIKK